MSLIYNGFLSEDDVEWINQAGNDGYKFWIEVNEYPPMYPWSETHLTRYNTVGEDCGGKERHSTSAHFTVIGNFVGFKNEKDQSAVKNEFKQFVVAIDPFSTKIQ